FPQGSRWFLEDLGSTNGTFVEGNQLTRTMPIDPGTGVRIGKTVMELKAYPWPLSSSLLPTPMSAESVPKTMTPPMLAATLLLLPMAWVVMLVAMLPQPQSCST